MVEPTKSKQIGEGTYIIDSSKDSELTLKESKTIYTLLGYQDKLVDGLPVLIKENKDTAFARKEIKNNRSYYYIRLDDNGSLFNPMSQSISVSFKGKLLASNDVTEFTKVKKECFEHYLEFLKTKNVLHYKFAERARF